MRFEEVASSNGTSVGWLTVPETPWIDDGQNRLEAFREIVAEEDDASVLDFPF